jgi:hypothetical protein
MQLLKTITPILICLFAGIAVERSFAATQVINAGATLTLNADLTLTGTDSLLANGTASNACFIAGNGHRITGSWTGLARLRFCQVRGLGTSDSAAVSLTATGSNTIDIQHCLFDSCGGFVFINNGSSATVFNHNIINANSLVPAKADIANSGYQVQMRGSSTAQKLFQGNRIYKAWVNITGANSLIGGTSDTASNILIGKRVQIDGSGNGTLIRNNYLHLLLTSDEPYWSQVHTLTSGGGAVCEYNVIRDGEWIVQMVDGDFRYNVLCDILDHNLYRGGSKGRLYRNLFLGYAPPPPHQQGQMMACITVIANNGQYAGPGIEIFNNVFDGNNEFSEPGVEVGSDGVIKSLRNNVFYRFKQPATYIWYPNAIINTAWDTPHADTTTRSKMIYADYNCFYSPNAGITDNYYLTVGGKTERVDDGFARHDLPANGAVDAQVDPKFQGPGVSAFPYNDSDIVAQRVTVSRMVSEFFARYTPIAGSPLIDAGDPADGIGTDIGAVETGSISIEGTRTGPARTGLSAAPNPFKGRVDFRLDADGIRGDPDLPVLRIFDIAGRLVAALAADRQEPRPSYSWNACGKPAGIYLARVRTGNREFRQRLFLLE